jgi:hypothetical protein
VLLVLRHERRQVVHFNITEHPHSPVDGTTNGRGISMGRSPEVSPARSRQRL